MLWGLCLDFDVSSERPKSQEGRSGLCLPRFSDNVESRLKSIGAIAECWALSHVLPIFID